MKMMQVSVICLIPIFSSSNVSHGIWFGLMKLFVTYKHRESNRAFIDASDILPSQNTTRKDETESGIEHPRRKGGLGQKDGKSIDVVSRLRDGRGRGILAEQRDNADVQLRGEWWAIQHSIWRSLSFVQKPGREQLILAVRAVHAAHRRWWHAAELALYAKGEKRAANQPPSTLYTVQLFDGTRLCIG